MKTIALRLGYICYAIALMLILAGIVVLRRDFDMTRFDTLVMAFIFFLIVGYLLAGPPWPKRRKRR